jgi:hypothetical protein
MTTKVETLALTGDQAVQLKSAIKECLSEIGRSLRRMKADQTEIEQLKTETRATLARIKAL